MKIDVNLGEDASKEDEESVALAINALVSVMRTMSESRFEGSCGVEVPRNRGSFGVIKKLYGIRSE